MNTTHLGKRKITKLPTQMVLPFARTIGGKLMSSCDYVLLAGDIRRKRLLSSEIRLVVIPKIKTAQQDLFSQVPRRTNEFKEYLKAFIHRKGNIDQDHILEFFIQFDGLPTPDGLFPVTIYVADNDNLGYKIAQATGPDDFIVKVKKALLRKNIVQRGEHFYSLISGERVIMKKETDFFKEARFNYYPANQRF